MMKILEIIHDADLIVPTNIDLWVQKQDGVTTHRIMASSLEFPRPKSFDLLILHGGIQHLWNKNPDPWLVDEIRYVKSVLESGTPVIGFCLGCQIIAEVLGAEVYKANHKEMGFYKLNIRKKAVEHPLFTGIENSFSSFVWHQDHFKLTDQFRSLVYTKLAKSQMIVSDSLPVVGFQFHPEYTKEIIRDYASQLPNEKWMVFDKKVNTAAFLKALDKMPETFPLFEKLIENSLAYLRSKF